MHEADANGRARQPTGAFPYARVPHPALLLDRSRQATPNWKRAGFTRGPAQPTPTDQTKERHRCRSALAELARDPAVWSSGETGRASRTVDAARRSRGESVGEEARVEIAGGYPSHVKEEDGELFPTEGSLAARAPCAGRSVARGDARRADPSPTLRRGRAACERARRRRRFGDGPRAQGRCRGERDLGKGVDADV
jgi:hypothetical protein